jgi:hypothetical protein
VLIAARCGKAQFADNRSSPRYASRLPLTTTLINRPAVAPSTRKYHQHGQPRPNLSAGRISIFDPSTSIPSTSAEPPAKSLATESFAVSAPFTQREPSPNPTESPNTDINTRVTRERAYNITIFAPEGDRRKASLETEKKTEPKRKNDRPA